MEGSQPELYMLLPSKKEKSLIVKYDGVELSTNYSMFAN